MRIQQTDRVLTLRAQRKSHYGELCQQWLSYNGYQLKFSEEEFNALIAAIPEQWNSEKDKLVYFILFADGTYLAQREKEVYDYSTRMPTEKLYNYEAPDPADASTFTAFLVDWYTKTKLERTENLYDEILNNISDMSAMKYQLLDMRTKALGETDYIALPDVPMDADDKAAWLTYRQEWRDVPGQQAWIDSDYMNIEIPVSPQPKQQLVDIFAVVGNVYANAAELPAELLDAVKDNLDGLGIQNVIKKYTEISLKVEMLRGITKLKIPTITNDELSAIDSLIPQGAKGIVPEDQLEALQEAALESQVSNWQNYLDSVDEKIAAINTKLQSYNIDFTLGDIMAKVAEDAATKAAKRQADTDANDLITELMIDDAVGEEE